MTASERFKSWIDSLALAWGAQLGRWAAGFVMGGLEGIADKIGLKASEQLAPVIARLEAAGIPPELRLIIDELKHPTGEIASLTGMSFLNRAIGSIKGDVFEYFTRSITHAFSYSADFYLPDPQLLLDYYLRQMIVTKEELYDKMRSHGIPPEETDRLLLAKHPILPSALVLPAWLRDKVKYNRFLVDLPKLGLTAEQIELLTEMAYHIPGVQDIIRYVVKEAYSPEVYKAFGQDQEYPSIAEADAEKTGVRPDQLMKEWIAHWDLPSVGQGFEMLHRGEITQDELSKLLKAKDIMPFWRDKLTAISWLLPGRVEARILAQYGLVDKAFLVDLLKKDGLAEEYRETIADMMLVRGLRTDIQTRYVKGWLNSDGVKAEIEQANLAPKVAEKLYQWIVKNAGPERTAKELDLTKAEIVKGVKKGLIDWNDGIERLVALGYDRSEAAFIMAINIEAVVEEPTSTITVQTDTIRRQRRRGLISKEDEVSKLIAIGLDPGLAIAYADNDDLRLVKATAGET